MKKKYLEGEDDSENEFDVDEPEELQGGSDDEEWTPSSNRERGGRRQSSRLRSAKKPRLNEPSSDDDDDDLDDDSSDEKAKRKTKPTNSRGRGASTIKVKNTALLTAPPPQIINIVRTEATSTTTEKEFASGAFVVLKNDFHNKDDPPIWKIDGKALLQKYVPLTQEGRTLYKNTSTYSGWSLSNKEQYYPAPVVFKSQDKKEIVVEFLRDNVKEDADDD